MRTRHVHVSVPNLLALMLTAVVAAPAFTALAAPPVHASAIADSAATPPPPPPPAPAPAPTPAPAPPPAPAPAAADTGKAGAPAPTSAPAPAPAATPPPATIAAPAAGAAGAAVGAAAATPAAPLTKKQQRELEKANKRAAKGKKPAKVDPLEAWNKGKSWLSLRAGYARSTESGSADGNFGAGAGYARFLSSRWSLGLVVQGDLLGKFGAGAEIEYPVTLELLRHYQWKTALRPYLGFGGGAYYHKYYRTGDDTASWRSGFYFAGGINAPVSPHMQLGVDGRAQFVSGDPSVNNPLFGPEDAQLTQYSLKLVVARTF